jgi:hypothetical protein
MSVPKFDTQISNYLQDQTYNGLPEYNGLVLGVLFIQRTFIANGQQGDEAYALAYIVKTIANDVSHGGFMMGHLEGQLHQFPARTAPEYAFSVQDCLNFLSS